MFARACAPLALFLALFPGAAIQAQSVGPAVTRGAHSQAYPPSSIVVVIRRAYVLGRGRDRYCSPEVTVYNQAAKAVAAVMVSLEYTQRRGGAAATVGNTLSRFTVDPEGAISQGFYRLDTDSCEGITAKARVSTCLWRDRTECGDRVRFSDSGRIPIRVAEAQDE